MSNKLKEVNTETFEVEVLKSELPVLLKMGAPWCAPCVSQIPVLEKVAEELEDQVLVVSLDIDDSPEIAKKYGVKSIPTLILFQDGEERSRLTGRHSKAEILEMIKGQENEEDIG